MDGLFARITIEQGSIHGTDATTIPSKIFTTRIGLRRIRSIFKAHEFFL